MQARSPARYLLSQVDSWLCGCPGVVYPCILDYTYRTVFASRAYNSDDVKLMLGKLSSFAGRDRPSCVKVLAGIHQLKFAV